MIRSATPADHAALQEFHATLHPSDAVVDASAFLAALTQILSQEVGSSGR